MKSGQNSTTEKSVNHYDLMGGDLMAWHTVPLTQNGNSTVTWSTGPGGGHTTHDAVVVGPYAGSSYIGIVSIFVRADANYQITTRVVGAGAVSFRFWAEEMD